MENENSDNLVLLKKKTLSNEEVLKLKDSIPKRLDSIPFSKFHMLIIIALGISWVLDGYEVSLLSVLSGILKHDYLMNDTEIGMASSLYLLGCAIGSLFFGSLSSKWGRKTLFTITLGIYILSIVFTAISVNKYMLFCCRFFTGISVGGEYSSIFAAIDELLPASIRGRADLIIDGTWHLGSCVASIFAYLTLTYFSNYQELVTRGLFIIGVIFAFPVIFMRRYIPESPRWLLYKGQYKEAILTLESIENRCMVIKDERRSLIGRDIQAKNIINEKIKSITFSEITNILFNKHLKCPKYL